MTREMVFSLMRIRYRTQLYLMLAPFLVGLVVLVVLPAAASLGIAQDRIVVDNGFIGGDFGGKGLSIDEYAAYYLRVKREEWRQYHCSVSAWETDHYLGLY